MAGKLPEPGNALIEIIVTMRDENGNEYHAKESFNHEDTPIQDGSFSMEQIWLMKLQRAAGMAFKETRRLMQEHQNG